MYGFNLLYIIWQLTMYILNTDNVEETVSYTLETEPEF